MASELRGRIPATSEQISTILASPGPDSISLADLMKALNERALGGALLICTLPALIPMPFGIGSIFGIPPTVIALQMLFRRETLWLPGFVARREVSRQALLTKAGRMIRWMRRVEHVARPRLRWIVRGAGEVAIGFFVLLFALSITIPLPLSNSVPGIGILTIALAITEEDGALALVGVVIGLTGLALTAAASVAMGAVALWLW